MIKIMPFYNSWGQENVFKKVKPYFEKSNIWHTSSNVSRASCFFAELEKILQVFIFVRFIKKKEFSVPTTTLKVSQILHKVSSHKSLLLLLLLPDKYYTVPLLLSDEKFVVCNVAITEMGSDKGPAYSGQCISWKDAIKFN